MTFKWIRIKIVTAIFLIILEFAEIDCFAGLKTLEFNQWLDTIKGNKESKVPLYLDAINESVAKWAADSNQAAKIPRQLIEISKINLNKCNKDLSSKIEVDSTYQIKSPGTNYIEFYAKYQFNLCLQDMELKRAKAAAEKMDKSIWFAWYNAMNSANKSNNDRIDLHNPSINLAKYLKYYVPKIERKNFASEEEHNKKLMSELSRIIDGVCPYATRQVIELDERLVSYLDNYRYQMFADPISELWSKSMQICRNKQYKSELMKKTINEFKSQFDQAAIEDKTLDNSKPDEIKSILYESKQATIRMGNPIELLKYLAKSSNDDKKLLELSSNISYDAESCDSSNISAKLNLAEKYFDGKIDSPIHSYIKSMNALQLHLCDINNRMIVTKVSTELRPLKLAKLGELHKLYMSKGVHVFDKTLGNLLEPDDGYAICVREFINRYEDLDKTWLTHLEKATSCRNPPKTIMRPRVTEDATKVDEERLQIARDMHHKTMEQVCSGVIFYLPQSHKTKMIDLLKVEPGEKLGIATASLIDFSSICAHYNKRESAQDLINYMESAK